MTRFTLPYEDKPAPPPRRWTVLRVFLWTLLISTLAFWVTSVFTP
ncbi:MAG TPA: hypothetical protein VFW47_12805 [Phenylobacterium sp.]|nr:hypothetical protein [Phenylobacterium sp.]